MWGGEKRHANNEGEKHWALCKSSNPKCLVGQAQPVRIKCFRRTNPPAEPRPDSDRGKPKSGRSNRRRNHHAEIADSFFGAPEIIRQDMPPPLPHPAQQLPFAQLPP